MHDTHFIETLKSLNKKELKRFGEFVKSPYHNKENRVISFFDYIKKYAPEFTSNKLKKEVAFKHLFPKQKFDDHPVRELISKTSKLLYEFLAAEEATEEIFSKNILIVRQLFNRNLFKVAAKKLADYEVQLQEQKFLVPDYFQHEVNFSLLRNSINRNLLSSNLNDFLETTDFDSISVSLKHFYYAKMLEVYSSLLGLTKIHKLDFEQKEFKEIMQKISSNPVEYPLALNVLYLNALLLETDSEEVFVSIRNILTKHKDELPKSLMNHSLFGITFFCMSRIRHGQLNYRREAFEIDRFRFQQGLVFSHGQINEIFFLRVVHNAIMLREFEWVEGFIDDNTQYLKATFKRNRLPTLKAELCFSKGEYDDALRILRKIKYESTVAHVAIKRMYLQIYFETNEFDLFDSMVENSRQFLKNSDSIADEWKKSFANFITLCSSLFKAKLSGELKAIERIKGEIDDCENVVTKEWLVEKAGELKPKRF